MNTIVLIGPSLSIAINIINGLVYLYYGDLKHAIYWLAGAVVLASVTY